ncbi:MAG: hypothetical protein HY645_12800 [Acidobacteria bacterium]|nr:hypothetical protein [Acidobacteriota bacterium]
MKTAQEKEPIEVRPVEGSRSLWGVYTAGGGQILIFERDRNVCKVRESCSPGGWGRLLVEFMGLDAFHQAMIWAENYALRSRLQIPTRPLAKANSRQPVAGRSRRIS